MTTVGSDNTSGVRDSEQGRARFALGGSPGVSFARRQSAMLRAISTAVKKRDALKAVAEYLQSPLSSSRLVFLERDQSGSWRVTELPASIHADRGQHVNSAALGALSDSVCTTGAAEWAEFDGDGAVLAVPVFYQNQPPEVLCVVADRKAAGDELEAAVHFAALHLTLWDTLHRYSAVKHEAAAQNELLTFLSGLDPSRGLEDSARHLAQDLAKASGADRVAVAIGPRVGRDCRLAAISGMVNIDRRAEYVRSLEEALSETEEHESPCFWNADEVSERPELKTYRQLAAVAKANRIVGLPLRTERDRCVATVVLIFGKESPLNEARLANLARLAPSLGGALELVQAAQVGRVRGSLRTVGRWLQKRRGRAILAALCTVALSLFVPVPYRLACDCSLEPISRRFIAAPFDGTLERTLVDPGETVKANQPLARLDDRALQWEMTGLTTDYQQAAKRRDTALAARDGAAAQLAVLEMEQAKSKMQLAEYHREHLTIKSSIDGVIVHGDLERSEGAPVRIGQTLFEIAPLNRMVVEIAVPEDEIAHVEPGDPLHVRLDAFPQRVWSGQVEKIHPRAEIIDQQNVFVAQVTLDNEDGSLRPGMKGRAKIVGPRRAWGWILFHRPVDKLAQRFGW